MPYPAGLPTITVTGAFAKEGTVSAGTVTFYSYKWLIGPTDDALISPFSQSVDLDGSGEFTVPLPPCNHPNWGPLGWSYRVRIAVDGDIGWGSALIPYNAPGLTVDLADVINMDDATPTPGTNYVLLASRGAPGGVASLDGMALVPVAQLPDIPLGGVTDLEAILDAQDDLINANSVGLKGFVSPTDHGLSGWSFDPAGIQGGFVLNTPGLSYVVRVRCLAPVINGVRFHFVNPGSGLTAGQCFASVHNEAGAQLGDGAITADQSTYWATGGDKACPLLVPQGATPGANYLVRFWYNGSTGPQLSRGCNSAAAATNWGIPATVGGPFRFGTADAGMTTAPAGAPTLGPRTGFGTALLVGLY